MLASAPELLTAFSHIAIDARVGRQPWDAAGILRQDAATGHLAGTVIIGLGTNGNLTHAILEQIRQATGPGRTLILVNVYADRSWQNSTNAALSAFAASTAHVFIANWHDQISAHLALLGPDGIHPGPAGGSLYARTILDSLTHAATH